MKNMSLALWSLMFALLMHGCNRQEDADVVEANRRINEFQDSLTVWCPTVRRSSDNIAGTIGRWISPVSNANRRTELALKLSDILLSVDLANQPYLVYSAEGCRLRPREDALSSYYRDYVRAALAVMRDNGCSQESIMEFFFKALRKYKDACFSVPLAHDQLEGESREECQARIGCAMTGQSSYAMTMTEIRRIVLPYLSNYLPPELHDEFRQRIEPFFDFPSTEEFYEMMHPGYKYAPPSQPRPDAQKQVPARSEDAVEVDL